jgi:2-keto-4-pentenoate hydratase/2-oxohepta-3-ene-1,7-dioic acid hydratase in catechol pathway
MRLARCLTADDRILWAEMTDDGQALRLDGTDLYAGLRQTGEPLIVSRWMAPVEPHTIFGIGLNYRDHAAETGAALPEHPVVFMKPATTVTDPGLPIRLPAACENGPEVDYEAELAVVIGRSCRNVRPHQALDYVFGYTCANDVSARRWQKHAGGGQWIRGKSFDSFCPLGPVLVTAESLGDPQGLAIGCSVNGRVMQAGSTADMIFPVRELIAFLSRDTTLLPGTVILTGTPAGVGFVRQPPVFLAAGDEVSVTIERIGELTNPVRGPA